MMMQTTNVICLIVAKVVAGLILVAVIRKSGSSTGLLSRKVNFVVFEVIKQSCPVSW